MEWELIKLYNDGDEYDVHKWQSSMVGLVGIVGSNNIQFYHSLFIDNIMSSKTTHDRSMRCRKFCWRK